MAVAVERTKAKSTSKVSGVASPRLREEKAVTLPSISTWMAAAIFFVLTLIFYSGILFSNHFLWEDFVEQEFPFRTLASSSLAQGVLPHWNPYIFGGMPFMADIQTAVWYPTNLVQALFVSNGHESPVVMEWFILLHYALAGFGMFLLVRKMFKVDDWSALFSGVAYAFSGYIVAQAIHQMIIYQMALFPLIVYAFVKGVESWKWSLISGLLLGCMYLAGHPQSTLYLTFFLALLAAYEIGSRARGKHDEKLTALNVLRLAIPVIVAVGIFAIQLLPSQELADLSRRDVMTYEKSVEGSLKWGNLLTLILPRLFGVTNAAHDAKVEYWNGPYYLSWETAIYIGILPLLFGVVAAFTDWKKKYVAFFALMSVFAILFSLGDNFFLYKIFFSLPLFDKLRTPARMMMVFSFAMCALSSVGLANAVKGAVSRSGRTPELIVRGILVLVWLLALVGAFNAQSFLKDAPPEANASIAWAAGQAALPILGMALLSFLLFTGRIKGIAAAGFAILLTVIELFTYGMGLNNSPEDPRISFQEQPELIDMIKQDQAKELSRARTRMGSQMLVRRNQGAYDRIQLIEGYNPLVLQRVSPEMANLEGSADLMNIKMSIMTDPTGKVGFGERQTVLPRAKMYYQVDVQPDALAKQILKQDSNYDYRNKILIEEQPSIAMGQADPANTVQITSYTQNEITTRVKTASNGMLFFSEVYYPAWKAYVDGKPVKLYRAFTSLRAIEMPAGEHTVTMRYESSAFGTGSTISLITLLVSLGGLAFFSIAGRKKNEPSASTTTE